MSAFARHIYAALAPSVSWNLLLAAIPVVLGWCLYAAMLRYQQRRGAAMGICAGVLFLLWLLFVPNSCYLVTEWRHFLANVARDGLGRGAKLDLGLVTQIVLYCLYSGVGVGLFVAAIRPVERAFRCARIPFPYLAPALFLLISLGVYLGLVSRLNSWNAFTHSGAVVWKAITAVQNDRIATAVVLFALVLWAMYEAVDLWVDAMLARIRSWRTKDTPAPQRPAGGRGRNGGARRG